MSIWPKQVDWKRGSSAIACYYTMGGLPKDVRGKVQLNPDTDSAMLYSDRSSIWPSNKELDLGKSSVRKEYKSVIFWRKGALEAEVPVNYRPSPDSPVLRGVMSIGLSVDGDLGASKLVDSYFRSRPDVSELDSGALSSLVKDKMRGRVKSMLEGLDESNLRDPASQSAANDRAMEQLSELLVELGLSVSSLKISWRRTGEEKLGQMKATLERRKDAMGTKLEEQALERMKSSGNMEQLEKHRAETIATEFLEEDRARRDKAVLRRKSLVEEEEHEIEYNRKLHEGRSRLLEVEAEEEEENIRHKNQKARDLEDLDLSKQRMTVEEERLRGLSEIRGAEAEREAIIENERMESRLSAIERLADKLGASSDLEELSKLGELVLKGDGGRSYEFADVINPQIHEDLEEGLYSAKEVDGFISSLENEASNPRYDNGMRSDIWAGLAVMHRYRGNKSGSMDEAISRSLQFNKMNPIALKCRMDYLWNRHPQQFLPGKLDRFGEQLEEIESLLDLLNDHDGLSESDRSEISEKHKKCLRTLSRDAEGGDLWKGKLEAKYGLEV